MFALVATIVDLTIRVLTLIGLPGLFLLMVVESFGFPPLPSEVILPFSGFLVAEGAFPLAGAVAAALAGGLVGAYIAYLVGRWGRSRITGAGIGFLRLEERHIAQMDSFFARRGEPTVAIARVIPVVRSYISYPAGTARMDPVRFGAYTLIGATPFTLGLMYAGFVLRSHWTVVASYFNALDYVAYALIAAAAVYLLLLVSGLLRPGWPPRRRAPVAPTTPAPPGPGPP
ncbi:MAG TPA: DedA family protein [Thermoplasmata archaeon]|nr:DedA family protein [Thermoplasmata archaeon]